MGRLLIPPESLTVIAGLLIIAGQSMAWMKLGVWTRCQSCVLEDFWRTRPGI